MKDDRRGGRHASEGTSVWAEGREPEEREVCKGQVILTAGPFKVLRVSQMQRHNFFGTSMMMPEAEGSCSEGSPESLYCPQTIRLEEARCPRVNAG